MHTLVYVVMIKEQQYYYIHILIRSSARSVLTFELDRGSRVPANLGPAFGAAAPKLPLHSLVRVFFMCHSVRKCKETV